MLRLLLSLGPIAALLIGGLGSGTIVAAGFGVWNNWIENPRIVREQRRICRDEVEAAAILATRAEQARQVRIGEQSVAKAIRDYELLAANHRANLTKLEEEIKRNEAQRLAEGRLCPLAPGDILFLDNGVFHN